LFARQGARHGQLADRECQFIISITGQATELDARRATTASAKERQAVARDADIQVQLVDDVIEHHARTQDLDFGDGRTFLHEHFRQFGKTWYAALLVFYLQQRIGAIHRRGEPGITDHQHKHAGGDTDDQPAVVEHQPPQPGQVDFVVVHSYGILIHHCAYVPFRPVLATRPRRPVATV